MILATHEAGAGPPVVLLHGLFGARQNLAPVQRALAASFRAITLDLRNHGASPHDARMDFPAMARDVAATLAAMDALPCALMGHSMGGKVAMRLALEQPNAVTRLLVSDISPVAYAPHLAPLVAALVALPLHPGMTRGEADRALAPTIEDAAVRGFLLQNLRLDGTPAWRIGLAEIAAALPAIEGWEAPEGAVYPGPTLFVAGARSDYIRAEYRAATRALFPAARFVTVKDAGHWVHADNLPAFIGVLTAFLRA
jgi:pimeloyl-ACP methyl ester carboxylesterase